MFRSMLLACAQKLTGTHTLKKLSMHQILIQVHMQVLDSCTNLCASTLCYLQLSHKIIISGPKDIIYTRFLVSLQNYINAPSSNVA